MSGYFNINRDNQAIDQGGFWCEACLVGKPLDDQSQAERYCLGCYDFLTKEAEILTGSPSWKPTNKPSKKHLITNSEVLPLVKVSRQGQGIMSTLNDKKIQWT